MKTVAVIFGSRSAEHDVSVVTAISSIIKPLELTKNYKVEAVYIAKDGSWYWDEKLKDISLFTSGSIDEFLHKTQPVSVQFDGGMTLVKASGIAGRKAKKTIDIVFPATHGTYGEDGSLMGLLRMANVAFVGCDMDASVVAMDKVLSKQIALSNNLPTAKYEYFFKDQFELSPNQIIKKIKDNLKFPVFVKPAHLGSSIGISKAENENELKNAIEVAAHYDEKILVEEEIGNLIEVTLPIMGNSEIRCALLERPLTSSDDFFDFETKYMNGGKKKGGSKGVHGYSELPAKIDKNLYDDAIYLGEAIYRNFGCSGIARVDMLIDDKAKKVYFNEINPLPGDLYRHNWQASGVSSIALVEELIRLALDSYTKKQKINTAFGTNYLKQF